MSPASSLNSRLAALGKGFSIVRALLRRKPHEASLPVLVSETNVPRSTAQAQLAELQRAGFVVHQRRNDPYRLNSQELREVLSPQVLAYLQELSPIPRRAS